MQTYVVGGAVRDALLGLPVADRDWVVVGATPEQMVAQGFKPVGKDFPVFLHPETHEEYALARTERKTAPGYHGFVFHTSPDVSLVDPFHGQADLQARLFRHVSPAFAEDPVRVLRLARFAARFADFTVAPETMALMQAMVAAGEVDALVPERVWQEVAKGLMEAAPSRMLLVLRECGALARIMPELDALWGVPQPPLHHPEVDTGAHMLLVIDHAAAIGAPLPVRFAALMHDLGKGATPPETWPAHHGHEGLGGKLIGELCRRLKVPNDCRDLALLTAREHGNVSRAMDLRANTLVTLFERCDGLRKPERFAQMLLAAECDYRGRGADAADVERYRQRAFPQRHYLAAALEVARSVDAGAVAAKWADRPARIKDAVHAARVSAVKRARAGLLLRFQGDAALS